MKVDTVKAFFTYSFAFFVVGIAFYGLVVYPFELDQLVKGALIAWGGTAISFVFAQEIAKSTAAASQRAYDTGVNTTGPGQTTTVDAGPPVTVTTTPTHP